METVGLRERKKEKTRDALVHAAMTLFAKRGFDHVTVEEVAAACDVSPRTFFRYFASKEDVLWAESDGYRERLLESLAEQDPSVSPIEALEIAMRTITAEYVENRAAMASKHKLFRSTPSLQTRATERQQGWEREVADQLRATGRAKRMSDADLRLLVATTTAALRISCDVWLEDDNSNLDKLLQAAFARLKSGYVR